jgi:hypothetical protein
MKLPEMRRWDRIGGEDSEELVVDAEPDETGHVLPFPKFLRIGLLSQLNQLDQTIWYEDRSYKLPRRGVDVGPHRQHLRSRPPGRDVEGLIHGAARRGKPNTFLVSERPGPFDQRVNQSSGLIPVVHGTSFMAPKASEHALGWDV